MRGKMLAVVVALGFAAPPTRLALARSAFEHFDITLTVTSPEGSGTANWDTSPPEMGLNPRPVVEAKAGQEIKVEWSMRSAYPHGVMRGVNVHFYVVPAQAVGQKTLPPKSAEHVVDTAFRMDYLPDYSAKGSLHFRVAKPGVYLVRLTSEDTEKAHGHEHFSAVDLKVAANG